ncbi:MAG: 4-oxalocrotonate tautomerase family protein [Gemmatimonas sp.]
MKNAGRSYPKYSTSTCVPDTTQVKPASTQRLEQMPYVNIKITREGATPEQKAALIAGVTDLLVRVLNKSPSTTFVVIDEVEMEDWGVGGLPVSEYRARQKEAK